MTQSWLKTLILVTCIFGIGFSDENVENQEISEQQVLKSISESLFREMMIVKRNLSNLSNLTREELLSNLSSTAPRTEFIVHADIESDLSAGILSSTLSVSTNGQSSWGLDNNVALLSSLGYENTWQGIVNTNGGTSSNWFISALVNSEVLGESFGNIIVSQSPNNASYQWPPTNNLYSIMGYDAAGDASSGQDITSIMGSFVGPWENPEGNTDRLYLGLTLSGGCCETGSTFGPWYLYGLGILNPESETEVAYAIGYGNGGFGELTPGLLKLTGDLASGNISGFDYITTDIDWTSAGTQLHTSVIMDYIINDPDWGPWPNSMNGVILLGVTVEAALSGFDVVASVTDQTDPGMFILSSQYQSGNTLPVLSNLIYNDITGIISVHYSDENGNLPWKHIAVICGADDEICSDEIELYPDSHAYLDGTTFSGNVNSGELQPGTYDLKILFNDSDDSDQVLILEDFISFFGCFDDTACNFTSGVTGCEDGTTNCCDYPEINYDCSGNCIVEIDCFGVCGGGAVIDACDVCGGNSECDCPGFPEGTEPDCLGECGGPAIYDECGVCNGTGIPAGACNCAGHILDECGECGGPGIPAGECDCAGNYLDCEGICGGSAEFDECGVCQGENECMGCIDTYALNYNAGATVNDGSCEYNPASNLTAIFNSGDETIQLAWDTAIIEPEDPCPNEGEVLDCNGNCGPESWIGDGYCDDGTYYYSVTYGYCGTDLANLPAEDCVSIVLTCDELNFDNGDCDLECPPDYILDCYGTCAPALWIGDGYCDVGQWGAFLYCESASFDGGDCGSCSSLNEVQDCNGDCWPYDVIGDDWCDEDGYLNWDPFNFEEDFNCATFNYDGGDCSGEPGDEPGGQQNIAYQRTIKQLAALRIKDSSGYQNSTPNRDEISYQITRNQQNLIETMDLFYTDSYPLFGQNCYSVTALFPYGESDPTTEICVDAELSIQPGDVNSDGSIDIVDVVNMVNYILFETEDFNTAAADVNADGSVDIVDVVLVIGIILE